MTQHYPNTEAKIHTNPVIVLGDQTLDLFLYDPTPEGASPPGPPLFTREAWQYARGYDARYCIGGAAAIHAMLAAHKIPVVGNSLQTQVRFADPKPVGSLFILKKRPNINAKGKTEIRSYLAIPDANLTTTLASRSYTWRVDQGYLSAPETTYTQSLDISGLSQHLSNSRIVCLFDISRGFHRSFIATESTTLSFADTIAPLLQNHVLIIRTPDPSRFENLASKITNQGCRIVFLCPLDEMANDSLRTSGTWSDIWRHTYRYLGDIAWLSAGTSSDWSYDVIIPVYQDGVLWFGPNQWPVDDDR
jgi:hypothetical protein